MRPVYARRMSDAGLDADLTLDIRAALDQVARLQASLERVLSGQSVTVTADTSSVASAVSAAVEAADTDVEVTGQADELTGDISSAVSAADTTAEVTGDVTALTGEVSAAVSAADTTAEVDADAGEVTSAVSQAVESAEDEVTVTADASGVTSAVDAALDEAARAAPASGSRAGGEFATSFGRRIQGALRALPDVTIGADSSEADRSIARIRGELQTLGNQRIGVDVDAAEATRRLNVLRSQLDRLGAEAVSPDVRVDLAAASSQLTAFSRQIERVDASDAHVNVTADSQSLRDSTDAADALDSALIASSRSGVQLRTILQLGGLGAAAGGLFALVNAASELEQAVGGTTAVFGPAEARVVGFARSADEAAGLTEESARTLTSQIGGLLQGFDFTQQEAANLSVELAQLGADLAATFGGTSQEAVQALGAAIRGETDPIERFGISLNATQADLRAVELGLAASTTEVSANARAQGVLSLIMERSGNAQGQFAREVSTTAGQMERARAEFGNTAASIGQTLQPAMNELLVTVRGELIPVFGDLGRTLGPSLVQLVLALLPAFGTVTNILLALTPVVRTLANVIDAIPDPLLSLIATMLAFRAAAEPVGSVVSGVTGLLGRMAVPTNAVAGAMNVAGGATTTFRSALGDLVGRISPVGAALGIAAIGFTAYASAQARAAERQREFEADQQAFVQSLSQSETALQGVRDALTEMIESGEGFRFFFDELEKFGGLDIPVEDVFNNLNANVDDFSQALLEGGRTFDDYINRLGDGSNNSKAMRAALRDLADEMQRAAQESIESGQALGNWDSSAARAAVTANTARDGTVNYVAALDQLKTESAATAEQQENLAAATTAASAAGDPTQLNALGLTLAALQARGGNVQREFVGFAQAADAAGLSGEDLEAVAESLGVEADALSEAISGTTQPIRELADATQQTLPSISELAGDINNFSVSGFRDRLREAFDALVNFQENLQTLADRPRVAAAAAVLGPEFAAEMADAARQGREGTLNEIELLLAGLEQQGVSIDQLITGEIGPNLATSTGQVGQTMTDAFGANFNPVTEARPSIQSVEQYVAGQGAVLGESSRGLGAAGTSGFAQGFRPDPNPGLAGADVSVAERIASFGGRMFGFGLFGSSNFGSGFRPNPNPGLSNADTTVAERAASFGSRMFGFGLFGSSNFGSGFRPNPNPALSSADNTVAGRASSFGSRMFGFGIFGSSGFGRGVSGLGGIAGGAADSAVGAVSGRSGAARGAGYSVGQSIGQGLQAGINAVAASAARAAASLVTAAVAAARSAAQVGSPSRLFRDEIGRPIGEGIAVGITQTTGDVVSSLEGVLSAAQGVGTGVTAAVPLGGVTTAGDGLADAVTGGGGTFITVQSGAIVIQATDNRPETLANANAAADVLLTRLGVRNIETMARTR